MVRLLKGHRVVRIDDTDGAGQLRDTVACQAVRVARAVPALVVVAHGAHDVRGEKRLDDLGAGDRMVTDLGGLFVTQTAWLVEHIVGDADTADVMKEGRLGDLLKAAGRPAQLAAEQQHVGGDTSRVAYGVVVARVERRDQRLQVGHVHGLDRLIESGVPERQGEQRAHSLEELPVGVGKGILLGRAE